MRDVIKDVYQENDTIPIVVLGPEKSKNISFIVDEDEDSDKAKFSDLDINKYCSNIQIGYCEKED